MFVGVGCKGLRPERWKVRSYEGRLLTILISRSTKNEGENRLSTGTSCWLLWDDELIKHHRVR